MSFFQELKRRNIVRVAIAYILIAWVLLQGADFFLDVIDAPNWVIQVLLMVAAIGLPGIVIFSWIFEVTPEGIKREREVDRTASITHQTGRKLDRTIIAFLALVVAWFLFDEFYLETRDEATQAVAQESPALESAPAPAPDAKPSVAVLPFVNMSGDSENEYFSDGLTETLLHMLAQLPDLQVAARTSSFAFKGKDASIAEIATTLGVAHVLEGSVQRAGERVRVTAQLIRADDGFHVWSQNYTRPLEDIFAIQDEIAGDVASALDASLLGSSGGNVTPLETTDLTAYDHYLRGLEQQAIYSYESTEQAENHFKQALTSDPEFVDARLALVKNYLLKFRTGLLSRSEAETYIKPLVNQVYAAHPNHSLARAYELHLAMWDFSSGDTHDQKTAIIEELRGLLAVIPTEMFIRRETALGLHFQLQRTQEAIEVLQAGMLIDPLDSNVHMQLGAIYQDIDRIEDARSALTRAQALSPEGSPTVIGNLSELERAADNLPAALNWLRIYTELDPQDHEVFALIALNLCALGLPEEAGPWLAQAQLLSPTAPATQRAALEHALASGDQERGIQLARQMIEQPVSPRDGAFYAALMRYADAMMDQGRSREAYDYLATLRPEILDYDSDMTDPQGSMMQWMSILLMSGFETFENRQQAWNRHAAVQDALGFAWKQPDSAAMTYDLLFNGRTEEAIEQFLEHRVNVPIAEYLYRHNRFLPDANRDLYSDPRVDAALNNRANKVAEAREDVIAMLQTEEWAK